MFEEVGLTYQGREYTIPPERVMGLIATIEEYMTHERIIYSIASISEAAQKAGGGSHSESLSGISIPRAKLAAAMAAAFRYAGAKVTDEDIFKSLFGSDGVINVLSTLDMLLKITSPPDYMMVAETKAKPSAKKKPAAKAASSSRKRTKSR
jgi:hypothetical protein